jgi:hypothetical protein
MFRQRYRRCRLDSSVLQRRTPGDVKNDNQASHTPQYQASESTTQSKLPSTPSPNPSRVDSIQGQQTA